MGCAIPCVFIPLSLTAEWRDHIIVSFAGGPIFFILLAILTVFMFASSGYPDCFHV
jgi:hypothetical protein